MMCPRPFEPLNMGRLHGKVSENDGMGEMCAASWLSGTYPLTYGGVPKWKYPKTIGFNTKIV